ncbi:hypothetical protein [Staphylococcus gallinarum]|uniref:hypothetical protein n=1 Tax=Staphylococcus gallinarum TaxID=1293 RepID=UPI001E576BC2|nr:hypothetical protein [Staphylococcus gallinarum]MCD8845211.1 hypothetical protein [Staphylococcus gallinarum]
MNIVKETFKHRFLALDSEYNQPINNCKSLPNRLFENNLYMKLYREIIKPIESKVELPLGKIHFMNFDGYIAFKFSNVNLVFNTKQSRQDTINSIKEGEKLLWI